MTPRVHRPHLTELLASLDIPGEGRAELRQSSQVATVVLYVETQGGARATLYVPTLVAAEWMLNARLALYARSHVGIALPPEGR